MNLVNSALFFNGFFIKRSAILFNYLTQIKSNSLRIVYYHVVSDSKYPYYFDHKSISTEEFEYQIEQFKRYYEIISLSEAISLSEENKSLKNKLVITFDDGFKDNYHVAAPILKKMGCPATFFLIGNCIDNKDLMWRNKLLVIRKNTSKEHLNKGIAEITKTFNLNQIKGDDLMKWSMNHFPMSKKEEIVNTLWQHCMDLSIDQYLKEHEPYMTKEQILELSEQGFEMGCHSMSHPNFSKLNDDEFKLEILSASKQIENITGKKTNSFSYPFGQRASADKEQKLIEENPDLIKTFLGTRNKLNNLADNRQKWERDNLEFATEIAWSRFFLVSTIRSL